jgi:NADP-dependent 3-hydroxy acid dehydrogenase YdfG
VSTLPEEIFMTGINGKVVAITGASSGIGEATARLLAERGAAVALGARRTDRLDKLAQAIRDHGGRAVTRATDVTRPEDLQRLVDGAVAEFGRLDVLVSNAGISKIGPMADLDVDGWSAMIDVNLRARCTASPPRSRCSAGKATAIW